MPFQFNPPARDAVPLREDSALIWGYHAYPSTRTVDNFIGWLLGKG